MVSERKIPLNYASSDLGARGRPVRLVGAFVLSAFVAGMIADYVYSWAYSRYHDDSLEILIWLELILVSYGLVALSIAVWFRSKRARTLRSQSFRGAMIIGAMFGAVPAAGFTLSDRFPHFTSGIAGLWAIIILCPLLLPMLLFRDDRRSAG